MDWTNTKWNIACIVLMNVVMLGCGSTNPASSEPYDLGVSIPQDTTASTGSDTTSDDSNVVNDSQDAGKDALSTTDTAQQDSGVPSGPVCAKASACVKLKDTPYCDLADNVCVECLIDFHCKDSTNNCEKGKCVDVSCVPGTTTCISDNTLETCQPDGKGFEQTVCPDSAPICVGDKCRFCKPDTIYCKSPDNNNPQSTVVLKCNASGSDADIQKVCPGGQNCVDGKCVTCTPGQQTCVGNKAAICRPDGTGYDPGPDCGAKGLVCVAGLCVNPCASDLKSNTNVGCDYYAVDLDNALVPGAGGKVYDAQNSQFSIIVSNTKAAEAVVTVTEGCSKQKAKYKVAPNGLKIINLPDPIWKMKPANQDGTNINCKAYRVQSSQPIVAYQFNPLSNVGVFSNDASLLLPSNVVGSEYWVMTRQQTHAGLRGYLTVVAVQPGDTIVDVLVTAKTLAGTGQGQSIPAGPWTGMKKFKLKTGQVLNIETDENGADLTGSYIKADKPIVVFGGSEASNSPNTNKCIKAPGSPSGKCQFQGWTCASNADCPVTCCADHLEEQLFPTNSWGKLFMATKAKARGNEKDAWRILASKNGTVVQTIPPQAPIPTLNQGQWYEFESGADFMIVSNQPIQVGQFLASSHAPNPNNDVCTTKYGFQNVCTNMDKLFKAKIACKKNAECPNIQEPTDAKIGDPAFIVTVNVQQYLTDYVFLVPNKYSQNYVNIIKQKNTTVTLDNAPLAPQVFKDFGNAGWQVARLAISQGVHRLTSNNPTGVTVYGWDNYVSYGYPAGAGLSGQQ
ncbi:MAG TPA: hypothetical protein DCQ06_14865 [Myxococcales bacterium]|nr:hypothetical protein [Myxococcales bacterium]HAN32874.1 hypothetical protein [Myxococcales bacterium]